MPTENLIKEEILPYFGFRGHVHMYEGPSTENAPARPPATNIQRISLFIYCSTGVRKVT